jgi:glycosyltransferase involved in cell wall biosynthesis
MRRGITPGLSGEWNLVVYLAGDWHSFHRRPMLQSLAEQGRDSLHVVCINPFRGPVWRRDAAGTLAPHVERITDNLHVATLPVLVPGARFHRLLASVRTRLLGASLRRVLAAAGRPGAPTATWLYKPEHAWMLGLARETFRVYECYDEYTCDPVTGKEKPGAWAHEQALLREVDLVFTTSSRLFRSRRRHHPHVHYAPNGVPFRAFDRGRAARPTRLPPMPRPILLSVGGVTDEGLDSRLLLDVASARPDWSLVLLGPLDSAPSADLQTLLALPNVRHVPAMSHESLPHVIAEADVALIPYRLHDYAHARNPLKVWEYMAVGTPIVAAALEELVRLDAVVRIGRSHADFARQIQAVLSQDHAERTRRRALGRRLAAEHDWDRLTARMVHILDARRQQPSLPAIRV